MEKQKHNDANAKKEIERKRVAEMEARKRKLQIESFKKSEAPSFLGDYARKLMAWCQLT